MSRQSRAHQQRTARTALSRRQRVFVAVMAPLVRGLARLLVATLRPVGVRGASHLDALTDAGQPVLLCCWHQRLVYSVGWLLSRRSAGLQPGFLVSPSRDGELIAAVVDGFGARVIRGSANRTGARALRDMYGVIREGVSPIMHPDGPHGPAKVAKPGTPSLAQLTRTPMLPMSFAADRYWQLGSWDALIIPKPFARVVIHIGAPIEMTRGDDAEARAAVLGDRLARLDVAADGEFGVSPAPGRR
ncbi:lysophospholipid acyltransferase family protein [Salinisphaera sp. Q1T1-3]|uniref:lysophospholipid acyltransferase family protein n=1 Tax=Salinisphaera sp. Q1T1-3 TaxID=2321229 RepID=UPI000E74C472|nr:lysophospholipid acyltransferase family protein [Salinisphaera sp. Q1T1-3]RJS92503.1 DUF374 domain-containing protein [Salinisphaera sp. Q1T1-3]